MGQFSENTHTGDHSRGLQIVAPIPKKFKITVTDFIV